MSNHCINCDPSFLECYKNGDQCRKKPANNSRSSPCSPKPDYKANFLWGFSDGSIEEAGYEFANASNEEYRAVWWQNLKDRIKAENVKVVARRDKTPT